MEGSSISSRLGKVNSIGSGFISNNLLEYVKEKYPQYSPYFIFYAIDLNKDSCEFSQKYFNSCKNSVEIVNTDLLSGLSGLKGKVDVMIFNPVSLIALCSDTKGRV